MPRLRRTSPPSSTVSPAHVRHCAGLRSALGAGALCAIQGLFSVSAWALDVRALWDFSDPARSEATFREHLKSARGDDALSLQTQIARSFGLRSRFDEANALLNQIEPRLAAAGPEPKVRYLLERGRTLRSSKQGTLARPLFVQAVDLAIAAKLDELAVDAMHMVALVETLPDAQIQWNRRALALALASNEPNARNWDATLANNIGMTLHDQRRYTEALASFQTALAARERIGQAARIREARWMIAWTLRFLKRHDEALTILLRLEAEAADEPDGFVFEELGENLLVLGRIDESQRHFAKAWDLLSRDQSLDRPEPARLERMRLLGGR
jgi:tetratricopeptide (TPR) repeat protein